MYTTDQWNNAENLETDPHKYVWGYFFPYIRNGDNMHFAFNFLFWNTVDSHAAVTKKNTKGSNILFTQFPNSNISPNYSTMSQAGDQDGYNPAILFRPHQVYVDSFVCIYFYAILSHADTHDTTTVKTQNGSITRMSHAIFFFFNLLPTPIFFFLAINFWVLFTLFNN